MRLSALADGFTVLPDGADPDITDITEDSRRVRRGSLFVAVSGSSLDGHAYIPHALAQGAAAVVVERAGAVPSGVACVRVPSARAALATLAARLYGSPPSTLTLIGFTGTFGKTSTSEILRALLETGGHPTGVIGSLGARYAAFIDPGSGLTTPAPPEMHRQLRQLAAAGAGTVIIEVTSHALRMARVRGLTFAGGLIAAIQPGEHTDFHRSYDDYVGAKRLFLDHLSPDATLAYDADNLAARQLARESRVASIAGFSLDSADADLQVCNLTLDASGARFDLAGRLAGARGMARVQSALLGRAHVRNVALALSYALAAGIPAGPAIEALASLQALPRRMERYEVDGRMVLDDTAAHPDSFAAVFDVVRVLAADTSVVVYALRGNRGADINRRNALALSDLTFLHGVSHLIVTAAADRTHDTDRVSIEEVDAARQAFVERGRRFVWHDSLDGATREALRRTERGDLVVLLGAQGMNDGRRLLRALTAGTAEEDHAKISD
jgi:UDP-N-acetylmuramoyl-L-alanyl-D-glutamate--2,6-diaminopimelate ligase